MTGDVADTAATVHSPTRRRPGRPAASEPVGEVETRDLILAQARRLFLQRGFADVSVGEVAGAVGVTKPTLYYHFGDKEGLYAAVLCDLMTEVGGYVRLITALPHLSVRARLVELATGYFVHADGTMEPMLRDANELIGPAHGRQVREAYETSMLLPIEELLREGMQRGEITTREPRPLVTALMGLLDAFTDAHGPTARSEADHRKTAEMLVTLFLDGAAPRP